MYFLLPPSETKATGGSQSFALEQLSFPDLIEVRKAVLGAYGSSEIYGVLGMAAIDRYTGTLFSAVHGRGLKGTSTANNSLTEAERALAHGAVFIQSALFGLVGVNDALPVYKLNPSRKLNGLDLKKTWADAHLSLWSAFGSAPILDLRSKAYAELAPIPAEVGAYSVVVFVEKDNGVREQLNHFNKKSKGQLVRSALIGQEIPKTIDELAERASLAGLKLEVSDRVITVVTRQAT
jgi:uncharacterized protein